MEKFYFRRDCRLKISVGNNFSLLIHSQCWNFFLLNWIYILLGANFLKKQHQWNSQAIGLLQNFSSFHSNGEWDDLFTAPIWGFFISQFERKDCSTLCILNKLLVVKLNFQPLTFLRSITRMMIIAAREKGKGETMKLGRFYVYFSVLWDAFSLLLDS